MSIYVSEGFFENRKKRKEEKEKQIKAKAFELQKQVHSFKQLQTQLQEKINLNKQLQNEKKRLIRLQESIKTQHGDELIQKAQEFKDLLSKHKALEEEVKKKDTENKKLQEQTFNEILEGLKK